MNKLLLFSLLIFSLSSTAQVTQLKIKKEMAKKKKKEKPPLTSACTLDGYYGPITYKEKFYNELNSGSSIKLSSPPTLVGVGISGYARAVGPTYFLVQMDAAKYLPHQIMINDSTKGTFSGGRFGFGIGKYFCSKNGNLSLACYFGFNAGRCTVKNQEDVSAQKPFFCPKISIQPKLIIKRLAISIIISAQGDVTSSKWVSALSGKNSVPLSGLSQTGFIGLLSLGYRIREF